MLYACFTCDTIVEIPGAPQAPACRQCGAVLERYEDDPLEKRNARARAAIGAMAKAEGC